ncbi:allantoate amidohydrolase [Deinococcus cavernae]|uniref:Allantoate amidohydrolase n=2 Tax=Deinococcus cavernae TaxID=2320857 RepID=A0A418VGS3_9DEIO|nr:allantoate amidohydrolase [Deinococcus cavernae]
MTTPPADLTQAVLDTCNALAGHTEVPGEINRPFLCPCTADVHDHLKAWAGRLGLSTRVDAVGNLRARREADVPGAPTLYLGSHLDTVPNAGKYDGVLGVALGYALVEALGARPLPYAIEVVAFSEEEGVRFGVPFIGSRALVGTADPLLDLPDAQAVTVRQAIRAYGLDPQELKAAEVTGAALGYFEIHIEQGPVLQAQCAALGVVEAIAGQNRFLLRFEGQASHAGTTPMPLRKDALAAAARFVVEAEQVARSTPGLVATVGVMQAEPGAINVVSGVVNASLDIRHARDGVRQEAVEYLLDALQGFCRERGVSVQVTPRMEEAATPMSGPFKELLHRAADELNLPHPELVSGAGHDAQIMATRMPAGMLFVRSPNALSHHPDEMVNAQDVSDALRVGLRFLELLAGEVQA